MSIDAFALREPLWVLLTAVPLLPALWRLVGGGRTDGFADAALLPWVRLPASATYTLSGWLRLLSRYLGWCCFAVALAGPRQAEMVNTAAGDAAPEVMLVVDLSASMAAADIAPTRLARARLELSDLLNRAGPERFGLVVFAHRPHLMAPPSPDHRVVRHLIDQLRPALLPTEGSDVSAALTLAASQFQGSKRGVVLLVSDGDLGGAPDSAALLRATVRQLAATGVAVYVLGAGNGADTPVPAREGGWLEHAGRPVVSRLNQPLLEEIARESGGRYARVSAGDSDWQELYDNGIARRLSAGSSDTVDQGMIWRELQQPFLYAGLLLILGGVGFGRRAAGARHMLVLPVVALVGIVQPTRALAAESIEQQAEQALRAGHYGEADRLYGGLQGYRARMGQGASAYRQEAYPAAIGQFIFALLAADADSQRADALFNLANSYFKLGDYRRAASIYIDVQRYQPHHPGAAVNGELAEALAQEVESILGTEPDSSERSGRGPRQATAIQGLEPGGGISLAPVTPTEQPYRDGSRPLEREDMQALIERGISRGRLADSKVEEQSDPEWSYALSSPTALALLAHAPSDDSALWQRLFELEEGFPAPLEQPRAVEGVPPW